MESDGTGHEKRALEWIKNLVRTQVVRNEGEDNSPPSFLDIYNAACEGLRATDYSLANPDTACRSSESKTPPVVAGSR